MSYLPEQPIIVEGEEGTHFYIIVDGEVRINKAGQAGELARRGKGDYFGETFAQEPHPTLLALVLTLTPTPHPNPNPHP